jgi:carboxymethylenebutenolidase
MESVTIETRDGKVKAQFFTPVRSGSFPAVIFYMDGVGYRPVLFQMGQRLADAGFAVLLADLFYRSGAYAPFNPNKLWGDENERARVMALVRAIDNSKIMSDTESFLKFLDGKQSVSKAKIGCVGYCMGGQFALTAAGTFPDRVGAAASFHGSNLAVDKPDSPHHLAPKMKATIYVGVAEIDQSFSKEQGDLLEKTLTAAGVRNTVETYPGAHHGFAVDDLPVYNREASEKHWTKMIELFQNNLH